MRGLALFATVLVVFAGGCSRSPPDSTAAELAAIRGRLDALEAKQSTPLPAPVVAAPAYVLTTTWTNGGQAGPQTTQTEFRNGQACEEARASALAEGRRLRSESDARVAADASRGIISNPTVPSVAATCAAR